MILQYPDLDGTVCHGYFQQNLCTSVQGDLRLREQQESDINIKTRREYMKQHS